MSRDEWGGEEYEHMAQLDEDDFDVYPYDHIKWETEKAWLLVMGDKELWFPKSQCKLDKDKRLIEMPEWLAIEKELE